MFRKLEKSKAEYEWHDYTFTIDEWDYSNNSQEGDEPIIIGGFISKNYINDIYVDNGSSINVMYKHFYKKLPSHAQKKI